MGPSCSSFTTHQFLFSINIFNELEYFFILLIATKTKDQPFIRLVFFAYSRVLRGFMRILADFEVSRNTINSLIFSLFAPLFSPTLPVMQARSPQVFIFLTIKINELRAD
ncbi:hypothetical protein SAMN05428977_11142 [Nitrosomonas sp. Nm166]|nr:hypothetical protein SAMN05428977_11142 [Nitrosomonas sp. Nm166]